MKKNVVIYLLWCTHYTSPCLTFFTSVNGFYCFLESFLTTAREQGVTLVH